MLSVSPESYPPCSVEAKGGWKEESRRMKLQEMEPKPTNTNLGPCSVLLGKRGQWRSCPCSCGARETSGDEDHVEKVFPGFRETLPQRAAIWRRIPSATGGPALRSWTGGIWELREHEPCVEAQGGPRGGTMTKTRSSSATSGTAIEKMDGFAGLCLSIRDITFFQVLLLLLLLLLLCP